MPRLLAPRRPSPRRRAGPAQRLFGALVLVAVLAGAVLAGPARADPDPSSRSPPAGAAAATLAPRTFTPAGQDERKAAPRLFGTSETRSANIRPFPKWTDMLARHLTEESRGDAPCTPSRYIRCPIGEWLAFLEGEKGSDPAAQLDAVNAFVNRHPYVLDKLNYWETPREFAAHDGDCKDYAIAKYFSLRYLGWTQDDLRIVVVQDLNLRIAHAVLAVYRDHDILILDNQAKQVVRADRIRHYLPYYSINESYWWLHKP